MTASNSERLARRFLHTCLNIRDFGRSHEFYGDVLGLRLAMQTDGKPLDTSVLGHTEPTQSQASFMYDWRGPRSSSALELVHWIDPPINGEPYDDVSTPGLHAIALGVGSLEQTEERLAKAGWSAGSRGRSAFGAPDSPALLYRDPDGATVEIVEGDFAATTILGIRATCSNIDASVKFYKTIGFEGAAEPLSGDFVWGAGTVVTLSLPEDEGGFTYCLARPDNVVADGPTYATAEHCGYTRVALRVDDAHDTDRLLTGEGLTLRGPFPVDLGGTAVHGLHIGTVLDPDGILVEFVDRPKSFFRPPPAPPSAEDRAAVGAQG